MAETKRLGPWGWFLRAFAAGFGATFGVVVASVLALAACYALIAAGVVAFTSLGGVNFQTSGTSTPPTPAPTTTLAPPRYPTTVQPAPHVGGSYGGGNPYTSGSPPTNYPAAPGPSTFEQADNDPPPADVQAVPPVITIPSEPAPSPVDPARPLASPADGSP
jgi:hypothetical protein